MNGSRTQAAALIAAILLAGAAEAGGSGCGDAFVGPNEQCDDGNTQPGDGCSDVCLIENNYECSGSFLPTGDNTVADPGFEEGGGSWLGSTSSPGPIVCNVNDCDDGFFARDGAFWARLGSLSEPDQSVLFREVNVPEENRFLEFDVAFPVCDSGQDSLLIIMDDVIIGILDGADAACGVQGYRTERIDLQDAGGMQFNDGGDHQLTFSSTTNFSGQTPTVFLIDNVRVVRQTGDPVPSFCELEDRTLDYQDFDPGVEGNLDALGLTTFELGDPVPWGTTDDGICGTGQLPLGNVTGGAGEAACLDATASGSDNLVSLFCTSPINFETVLGAQLSFLLNVQLGQKTNGDAFAVFAGNQPPGPDTIFGYVDIFSTTESVGEFGAPPGELITADISVLDGEPEGYLCFLFASQTAFYAQVDDVDVSGQDCVDDADEDKLLGCFDNCTDRFNPDQTDSDGDGYGNACDADINRVVLPGRVPAANGNDCVVNFADLGALRLAFFSRPTDANWNPDADFNNDQVVNVQDLGIMRTFFFNAPGPSSSTSSCQAPAAP